MPFGEVFLEERNNTWNTPFLFNGKELDEETGLYYYGARYYNPRISLWYGVDPLAEKYPSMSPYNYCANNPVLLVDPDGRTFEGNVKDVEKLKATATKSVAKEKRRQNKFQQKIDKRTEKGKDTNKLENKKYKSKFREGQYQSTIDEITEIDKSDIIYRVNTNFVSKDSDGLATYGGMSESGNYIIEINVAKGYKGGLAHELVHGYQFKMRLIDFSDKEKAGFLYDLTDEVAAYTRQYAFTNDSRMYGLTTHKVKGYTNAKGEFIYQGLSHAELNSNTSYLIVNF